MTDKRRHDNGLSISRPRKKTQQQKETRLVSYMRKFDDGCYTWMRFLRAASHSISHTYALNDTDGDTTDTDDEAVSGTQQGDAASSTSAAPPACDVCLLAPRSGVALVRRGHARFCAACAETVTALGNGCPLCRSPIQMTMKLYD